MKQLGIVSPYIFEDELILSFSKNWISCFGGIPHFSISISKNGKLCFTSVESIKG